MQPHQQQFLPAAPVPPQNPQHGAAQVAQQPWGGPFPSLHLWPIQDTFQMKMIHLPAGQRVRTSKVQAYLLVRSKLAARPTPRQFPASAMRTLIPKFYLERTPRSGSREARSVLRSQCPLTLLQIFIKDLKSSNGTFINGVRLSPEGVESDPYELKSEDMVVSSASHIAIYCRVACGSPVRSSVSILSVRIIGPSFITRYLPRRIAFWRRMTQPFPPGKCLSSLSLTSKRVSPLPKRPSQRSPSRVHVPRQRCQSS